MRQVRTDSRGPLEFRRRPHRGPQVCARVKAERSVCNCEPAQTAGVAIRKCCGQWCVTCKGFVGSVLDRPQPTFDSDYHREPRTTSEME